MPTTIQIPSQLRALTGGAKEVSVSATTVGEALACLDHLHPGVSSRIFDENHSIRRFVKVFVGDEDVRYLGGTEAPLRDGDLITIVTAVAGG